MHMGKYKKQNKGYYWILTTIEILSRYTFAIPVYRKDTSNMAKAVSELVIIQNWFNLMMVKSFITLELNRDWKNMISHFPLLNLIKKLRLLKDLIEL